MKKKIFWISLAILLGAALLAAMQSGWRGAKERQGMPGRGFFAGQGFLPARLLLRAKDELGLSAEQVKQITALVESHEQWAVKFGAEMRIRGLKLRGMVERTDTQEAEKLIREQTGMLAELLIARLRLQADVRALLTPQQAEQLDKLKIDSGPRKRTPARQNPGGRFSRHRGLGN